MYISIGYSEIIFWRGYSKSTHVETENNNSTTHYFLKAIPMFFVCLARLSLYSNGY